MTVDEALRELLSISTDIRRVAVLDESGALLASGPGAVGASAGEAARSLWEAAARRASSFGDRDARARRRSARRWCGGGRGGERPPHRRAHRPRPALGLLLFDLRTCLADTFAEEATT